MKKKWSATIKSRLIHGGQVKFARDHSEKSGVDLRYSVLLAPKKRFNCDYTIYL